ncbi:hypothetical protein AABM26_10020 [Curtobacterium aetherium]|uniref:hypothetical protein n=1 Tax=Curtobacterium aetherium TaxID=2841594 RepID=UPI003B5172DC
MVKVTASYWQPDDSHCVSREYLKTAAWSATFTVQVRAGFTLDEVRAVRTALGSSTATVTAAAGDGVAAWELTLANPSGETPSAPLLVDEQGYRLVTAAAALPDVTVAQQGNSTTIRVRTPESVSAAAAWLRTHVGGDDSSVYVGTAKTWTTYVSVTGLSPVSEATVETAAQVAEAKPDVLRFSVSGSLVTAVVPTERQAKAIVAAFEGTPADSDGQRVSVWWPDGNGHEVSGSVGSAR